MLVVLGNNLLRLPVRKLLRVTGAVIDIPLPALQVLQIEFQRQIRHVAGDEAPDVFPVQTMDQRLLLVGVGKRCNHIGERRLVVGDLHIRVTEFAVLQVFDGPVQTDQLQLIQLVAGPPAAGGLNDLPRDKLLQGLTENINPAGLAGQPEDGIFLKLVLFIGALNELPDNAIDVCPQQQVQLIAVDIGCGNILQGLQPAILPIGELPAIHQKALRHGFPERQAGHRHAQDIGMAVKGFLDPLRNLKQEVEVVFNGVIVGAAAVLVVPEPGGEDLLCLFIGVIQSGIDGVHTVPVHVAEHVHIEGADQLGRVREVIAAQLAGQGELEQLHHPVGQVIAAKVGIAVLIGRSNINLVGYPVIVDAEPAGGQVRGTAAAVDNERLVELAVLIPLILDHFGDGVVEDGHALVQHIFALQLVIGQNLLEELDEKGLLLHRRGDMQAAEIALEPLPGAANHILQKRLDDVPAGGKHPVALAVHQLLHPVGVANPAFEVVEDAEALVDVAQMEQPVGLMAEGVADLAVVDADDRRHGGKDQRFRVVMLHIQVGHIVDLVPLQNLGDGVALQPFKVGVVQIDARGGVGGAEVDGQGHPALQQGPHLEVQDGDRVETQVLRHDGRVLHIEPVQEIGLDPVHAVKGVVPDPGLLAVQPRRLGDEQAVGIAAIGPEVEDGAQLPAADQQGVGVRQLRQIADGEVVEVFDGDPIIGGDLGAAPEGVGVVEIQPCGGKQLLQPLPAAVHRLRDEQPVLPAAEPQDLPDQHVLVQRGVDAVDQTLLAADFPELVGGHQLQFFPAVVVQGLFRDRAAVECIAVPAQMDRRLSC